MENELFVSGKLAKVCCVKICVYASNKVLWLIFFFTAWNLFYAFSCRCCGCCFRAISNHCHVHILRLGHKRTPIHIRTVIYRIRATIFKPQIRRACSKIALTQWTFRNVWIRPTTIIELQIERKLDWIQHTGTEKNGEVQSRTKQNRTKQKEEEKKFYMREMKAKTHAK